MNEKFIEENYDTQNTKNEQQKDLCITSEQLTEQWKKSELPEGWYYVKGNRAEGIYAYTAEYLNNMYRPRNGERIIEQVPSYEQWQKHRKILLKTQEKNCDLEIINTQLKELLKDCVEYVKKDYGDYLTYTQSAIYQEINQALGESK